MNFKKNTDFRIAKGLMQNIFSKTEPLDYKKWVEFIDNNRNHFIWYENTENGRKTLENINEIPDEFKERVLSSLNKLSCYAEYDGKNDRYNLFVGFYESLNYIKIQFARSSKLDDLKIFILMAKHLDALLLKDGTEIIDDDYVNNVSPEI